MKQAYNNVNINGFDYQEYIDEEILLKTYVGVRNHWFNEWLYPKLYDKNKNDLTKYGLMIDKFCQNFGGIIFERMVRYTRSNYRYVGNYNSLKDYLADVFNGKIWDGRNLEYLQICTPKLSLTLILRRDIAEIEKLKEQIKFHIKLMLLLDWILHK